MAVLFLCLLSVVFSPLGFVLPFQSVRIHNHQNSDRQTKDNVRRDWGKLDSFNKITKTFVSLQQDAERDSKALSTSFRLNYRRDDSEGVAIAGKATNYASSYDVTDRVSELNRIQTVDVADPSMIEFVATNDPVILEEKGSLLTAEQLKDVAGSYPLAAMMQGSAMYIAAHSGQVSVFHIPAELVEDKETCDHLLSDMALCWLLGMKIVIVVGSRYESDTCEVSTMDGLDLMHHPHECHNALRITDAQMLRDIEEEAGFCRTEIERKLNRFLRAHDMSTSSDSPNLEGNVVSGNFYKAQQFGVVRGEDFQYTGFCSGVNPESIMKVLNNNDIVLLCAIGMSPDGELVNVNGYHLAATVASSLKASKIIYVANHDSAVLRLKGEKGTIQELPLSFSKLVTNYHQVKCHNTGFATFERARQSLSPGAVELLLHLGWSNWALDRKVGRAHIINPSDGALLEEMFTRQNGANTCLYHDEDSEVPREEAVAQEDWDDFFASAREQEYPVFS
jgi:amino-acid N-acetyltransferase